MEYKYFTIIFSVFILFIYGCKTPTDIEEPETYKGIAAKMIEESGPVMMVATDEDGFALIATRPEGTSQQIEDIQRVVAADNEGNTVVIFFGEEGLPERAYVDNLIVIFDNYTDTTVDIGVVEPNGDIHIAREIETTIAIDLQLARGKIRSESASLGSVARWSALAARGVTCGLSGAAAVSTGGIATPVALTVCGSLIVSVASELGAFEENEALQRTADYIGWAGGFVGCVALSAQDCIATVVDLTATAGSTAITAFEDLADEVKLVEGALNTGTGDVQVTLTWDATVDLDLWVTDPFGERIYYANRTSQSGGQLDQDVISGFGPENIFWPSGEAPSGQYTVQVDHYSGGEATNYTVLVQAFGNARSYSGNIQPNQTINVTTFSDTEIASKANDEICQTCAVINSSISKK